MKQERVFFCLVGLPVEWHSFSIFVPENEQDVVTGNGRFQVTSQLGRVTDYHFRVNKWHWKGKRKTNLKNQFKFLRGNLKSNEEDHLSLESFSFKSSFRFGLFLKLKVFETFFHSSTVKVITFLSTI